MVMTTVAGLVSCVEDEGNYELAPINEISISGIEESYSRIAHAESLVIEPEIKGTISNTDESQLEYKWFFSESSGMDITHTVISTERNLNIPVDVAPGKYQLYYQVTDKSTGLKWETSTNLEATSPFVRGFYLFGDKEDGTCGMDFVSFIDGRDTTVIKDIFVNSANLRGAKNLVFTGNYPKDIIVNLWAIADNGSYQVENSSELSSFDVLENLTGENMIFPTVPVTHPLKVVDVCSHASGSGNVNLSRSMRIIMTENEIFANNSIAYDNVEAYGNPYNRYSDDSDELFKPAPYVFNVGNAISAYSIQRWMFFDETNHRFVGIKNSSASYCTEYDDDSETPFYFDQTKYTPVRTLVYGENGYGNAGRSYALMTDADGKYYVYGFSLATATPGKYYGNEIDMSVATNFANASHYAFFSMQAIILYSVGTQLWGYDYNRKEAKMLKDFGAEITYLAMDDDSNDEPTDFIVATYNAAEKGTVSKFTIADNQNKIEITPHEKEVWKTDLKVVKVEYRNHSSKNFF